MALLLEAARAAFADAGLTARDVDGIIAPGTTYAELHELARELGVRRQFFNAAGYSGGAAVASAPPLAALASQAGGGARRGPRAPRGAAQRVAPGTESH